jgi:hypothetical protein
MVMAVITPQFPQSVAGLTRRIGAGMFVACTRVRLIPASEVGKLPAPASTGCLRVLPTPIANTVMTCPGAMLIGAGNRYPAPTMVLRLALWHSAGPATAATIRMKRVASFFHEWRNRKFTERKSMLSPTIPLGIPVGRFPRLGGSR